MITAIDTNVLIDILGADPIFGIISKQALKQCMQEGTIYACEITWIETATMFSNHTDFLHAVNTLGIEYSPIQKETALLAAKAWREYREQGGKRERVVADFLIGAHGQEQCDRLLTRDRGFYRKYFSSLVVLDPRDLSLK